jgi:hypothetical protein
MVGEANYPAGWTSGFQPANAPFIWQIARGMADGLSVVKKFGERHGLVGTDVSQDVWPGGGLYTGMELKVGGTAETLWVASTDAADDALTGQGAQTVVLSGLGADWKYQEEEIIMDGLVPVVSGLTWFRMNRMWVHDAGTSLGGVGDILATGSTTGAVYGQCEAGLNQSQITAFTIPAGREALIVDFGMSLVRDNGQAGSAEVTLRMGSALDTRAFRSIRMHEISSTAPTPSFTGTPLLLPEYSDLTARVENLSSAGTNMSAQFDLILFDL